MDAILASIEQKYAPIYQDDIVTFPKTPARRVIHVRQVLTLLKRAGTTLKLKKLSLSTNRTDYLGPGLRHFRLKTASHTADVNRNRQKLRK